MAEPSKHGILLIDKPRDMTSFGVVSRLRRLIGEKKIGHTGTLDPFAEGLLAVCIGQATAAVQFMDTYDKTYQVSVLFGTATDTMDLTGTVIEHHDWLPSEWERIQTDDFASIRQAVKDLLGEQQQIPPMYSAIKVDGQPLYTLARAGQTIERKARPIVIHQASLDGIDCRSGKDTDDSRLAIQMTLKVSKGTYIRVIADELGRKLGYYGHAERLVRTQVGPFALSQALSLEALDQRFSALAEEIRGTGLDPADRIVRRQIQDRLWQELVAAGQVHDLAEALAEFPRLQMPADMVRKWQQGQKLMLGREQLLTLLPPGQPIQECERLAVHGPAGLSGVCHLEWMPDTADLTYRIVTERIFIHHERLLSE